VKKRAKVKRMGMLKKAVRWTGRWESVRYERCFGQIEYPYEEPFEGLMLEAAAAKCGRRRANGTTI
jgi:hypothetical protein